MHITPAISTPPNVVTNQDQNQPPAKAARALLQSRTDLTDEPFGKLVSLFARGQDIPPASSDQNATATSDQNVGDVSPSNANGALPA
jgi:hypothetical protein